MIERGRAAPSPGEEIAASLRKSPLHVDPMYARSLPAATRRELLAEIEGATPPIFVLVVPLVAGGEWSDPEELATVVHDRLGRSGIYVTLDDDYPGRAFNAYQWGGTEKQRYDTKYAAWAVFHDDALKDATLGDRIGRCLELIKAGNGKADYERLTADIPDYSPGIRDLVRRSGDDGSGLLLPVTAGTLAVAGVGGLLLWRHRRMAAVRRADDPILLPRTVFATAARANEDELRAQAGREVLAFGELLDQTVVDTADARVRELMTAALDAYQAAGKVLDRASGTIDLAGVLVLVDQGRDALASAVAKAAGHDEVPPSPLCFFNPLHGDSVGAVHWRPIGTRRKLKVSVCRRCTEVVHKRESPEMLMDGDVPYFSVDPQRSVWAATGYGQFRGDLVQRVLRGDHARR